METRVEKYKRLRREKFFRKVKFSIILIVVCTMSYGIYLVNDSIKEFDVIENDNLIRLDINNKSIDLLGKSYYIDIQRIIDVFKP